MIYSEDNNLNNQIFNNSQISNLTFIDTNLTNYQSLIPDTNNSNVVLIDSEQNGIEQITEALEQYSNLDSISIFSHGDVGSLQLGNTYLSDTNLDNYQEDLAAWGNTVSAKGDLLLYGCNVGAATDVSTVAATRANAKVLDLIEPQDETLDGLIVMNDLSNTGLSWNNDYTSNSVASNQFDFTSVAMHEIGHILGFVSAADAITIDNYDDSAILADAATGFDLFRYVSGATFQERNMRMGLADFSIDKGQTSLAIMSGGMETTLYGDGYQGSHWFNQWNIGLMDPVAQLGRRRNIEELDLKALDVIGWDRVTGTKSVSALYNEAQQIGQSKTNVNRNVEINEMLSDWRWARRGSRGRLRQEGNMVQFLAQEGFFSLGTFRESFDFSTVDSVAKQDLITVVDNKFEPQELNFSSDSDEITSETNVQDVVQNEDINYEQMLAKVAEDLSDYQWSQLNLDDLGQLIFNNLTINLQDQYGQ